MTKLLSREQLYNQVWEKPMVHVAREYGLSDRGLSKLCERNGIPVPPRGYWAKKKAGFKIRKPPLPATKEGLSEKIVINKYEYAPPKEVTKIMETARQKIQTTVLVPLSSPEAELHSTVRATAKTLRKVKPSAEAAYANGNGHCGIDVGLASTERVIVILDAIARALDEQGLTLQPSGTNMKVVKYPDELTFTLTEHIQKQKHIPTPEERVSEEKRLAKRERDVRSGNWSFDNTKVYPEYDFIRTGELGIQIVDQYVHGARRSWKDGKTQKVEDLIDEIAVGIVAYLAGVKARREENEHRQRQWALEAKQLEIARQHQEREKKRREFVLNAAEKIAEIKNLEEFLLQLQAYDSVDIADEFTRMIEWVETRIIDLKAGLSRKNLLSLLQKNNLFPENDPLNWTFAKPDREESESEHL